MVLSVFLGDNGRSVYCEQSLSYLLYFKEE